MKGLRNGQGYADLLGKQINRWTILKIVSKNCVSCCGICNKAKRNLSLIEFQAWINRLVEHTKAK